jgi:carbon monoxide dehydrogenase subunit G
MKCVTTVDIAAPIERVFSFVDDPEKLKLWLDGIEETTYLTDPASGKGVGTKFRQRIREHGRPVEYDGEVTVYSPPRELGVRLFVKQFSVQVDYRFTPVPAGTRLDYSAEVTCFSWFMRVMGWLFGWVMQRTARKQMARLKAVAEASK